MTEKPSEQRGWNFGRRDLKRLYGALSLAILMEETCAEANIEKPYAPSKEMREERIRCLKNVRIYQGLQRKIWPAIEKK